MLIGFPKNIQIQILWKSVGGSRVVPCEQKEGCTGGRTDGLTYMTDLMVSFRNLANAPKNDNQLAL